ncbi:MAG: NAD(P)/FAD-dependent oxidoreductase [Acidobacteria bacterium]|nr:NAD(P)/FAD-dependent oxidoreductase [Acidobacteriota bacterium]
MLSHPLHSDVLVIGSGISGASAAHRLVELGAETRLLDIGYDDGALRQRIPDEPFDQLRSTDSGQADYFIGRNKEGVPRKGVVVGAQLTPPRQFIHKDAAKLFPIAGSGFHPLMATSAGGLGAGWGAASFVFSPRELESAGLPAGAMAGCYERAAELLGISGDRASPVSKWCWPSAANLQPPLEIDDNAANILRRWKNAGRVHAGSIPMAVLTRDRRERRANPYFDMDFYGDSRRSVFRPRYVIEELRKSVHFHYAAGRAVFRLHSQPGQPPRALAVHVDTGAVETFTANKIVLCANALNSGRIVLNSLDGLAARRTTVLCNPYTYFPTINLGMLGRPAAGRRHSLAQFGGVLLDSAQDGIDGVFQMYSYRSLLLFKLVKEMPLPPQLGLLVARALVTSMAIFGIFFRDRMSESKCMELVEGGTPERPGLRFTYNPPETEKAWRRACESEFRAALLRSRCVPIGKVDPGPAGSIHYAGTIPFDNPVNPGVRTLPDGTIDGLPNVYSGDSASWNTLPAKGLSFTLAANAIRVAELVARAH